MGTRSADSPEGLNNKYGLTPSRHSGIIVGYDEKDGMPLMYDWGEITRLDNKTLGYLPITNITIPKGMEKFNKDYMLQMEKEYTPATYKTAFDNEKPKFTQGSGQYSFGNYNDPHKDIKKFAEALSKNKKN